MSIVISDRLVLTTSVDESNHPALGIDSVFHTGTITASGSATDSFPENVGDGNTYDFWQADALPGYVSCEISAAQECDYLGIAAHNLGDVLATVVAQYWDGAAWQDAHDAVSPTNNKVLIVVFDAETSTKWRLYVTGAEPPLIGVVNIGKLIRIPRNIYGGHTPVTLNRNSTILKNITEAGYDAGVSHLRTGSQVSAVFNNLEKGWIRNNLEFINNELLTKAFFFAWRPTDFPDDVAYCWLNSDATANNSGKRGLMDMKFDAQAHIEFAGKLVFCPGLAANFVVGYQNSYKSYIAQDKALTLVDDDLRSGANNIFGVAFSPDNSMVAGTENAGNKFYIFSTADWSVVAGTPIIAQTPSAIQAQSWHPDGDYIAVGLGTSPYYKIYDTSDWSEVTLPDPPTALVYFFAFSPDGTKLACSMYNAGSPITGGLVIYNTSNWTRAQTLTIPGSGYRQVGLAWNHAGTRLAVGHAGGAHLTVYDTSTWTPVSIPSITGTPGLNGLEYSPDDAYLAAAGVRASPGQKTFIVFNAADYSEIASDDLSASGTYAIWHPDSTLFYLAQSVVERISVYEAPLFSYAIDIVKHSTSITIENP